MPRPVIVAYGAGRDSTATLIEMRKRNWRPEHTRGKGSKDAQKYEYRMPLMDWGYDLDQCMEIIEDEGLPMPPKSACCFRPFQKTYEVDEATPEARARTILMDRSGGRTLQ